MKNPDHARNAYLDFAAPTRNNRSIEYQLFARLTRKIQQAMSSGPAGFTELAVSLNDNLKLWNTISADISLDSNPLPPRLKAQIFYLAEFTRFHTARVIAGDAEAGILIEINTSIMRGLCDSREAAA